MGHDGFLPPQSTEAALADHSFTGVVESAAVGVVEIGYTLFPAHRGRGYAIEVVAAQVEWPARGEVGTVLATVVEDKASSAAVLKPGLQAIGTCRDRDGVVEVVLRGDRGARHRS